MEMQPLDRIDDRADCETPEDVAILYSWANLEAAKYPDFSENRREYRAQMRHRAAEQLRLMELRAQSEAEAAAAEADAEAAAAHAEADAASVKLAAKRTMQTATSPTTQEDGDVEDLRRSSLREAAQQARRAAAERLEAARRAEAAALADSIARREEREIAEAQASALRQAAQHAEAEIRSREKRTSQPDNPVLGRVFDLNGPQVVAEGECFERPGTPAAELDQLSNWKTMDGQTSNGQMTGANSQRIRWTTAAGLDFSKPRSSEGGEASARLSDVDEALNSPRTSFYAAEGSGGRPVYEVTDSMSSTPPAQDSWGVVCKQPDPKIADSQPGWLTGAEPCTQEPERPSMDASGPAWLYPKAHLPRFVDSLVDSAVRRRVQLAEQSLRVESGLTEIGPAREVGVQLSAGAVENTLLHSREQVDSRWFALRGIFAKADPERMTEKQPNRETERGTPFIFICSLAGGVGKTSMVATVGRALSSLGEKVLLTDTTSQGLIPFYFGASGLHSGVVRTFSPPTGSTDAPIRLLSYDFTSRGRDSAKSESEEHHEIFEDLLAKSKSAHRVLLDVDLSCSWMVGRMAWMKPTILILMAADMNSVISLESIEKSFSGLKDAEGKPLLPVYLLNQFDSALPLHLDVHEVLKQQLGDRLLPLVVRRAAAVSEALAEGMTIVDYDPESEVARDYMAVANWIRNASAPATIAFHSLRWIER